jgi:hypothetical protein
MITLSKQLATYTNFNKGRNDSVSSDVLLQEELKEAINIKLSRRGGYSQREGCIKAFTTALDAGEVKRILKYGSFNLATVGTKLVKWDGTSVKTGLNSGYIGFQFFTNSKLYFVDGTKYWLYDGATVTEVVAKAGADLTPIKRCTTLLQRGQRMFAMGDPQFPNYLYFSEPGEPNNFLAASIVKAISDDDEGLVGLSLFHESVIAFKRRKVYAWSGWDPSTDVRFDELDADWGTISPQSIVKAENFLLYLGDDAIMALYGNDAGNIGSMKVSPGITELLKIATNKEKAVAVYYKGKYYLAICTDGTGQNNLVLVGHVNMAYQAGDDQSGSSLVIPFTVNTGWKVSQWFIDNNDDLFFGSYNGFIYKAFEGKNDAGVAISSKVVHRLNLGDSFRIKKLKSVLLLARQFDLETTNIKVSLTMSNKTISMDVRINDGGIWDVSDWDDSLWDFTDIVVKDLQVGNKCSRLEVTIEHDALDEPMTIYGFAALYKPKKAKGVKIGVTNKQTI